ncbi:MULTISPECIES: hypothetical protein [Thermoactinomyces]|jgi:DNA invertase Pin-like site-specific DNA recombinase|uniref:Uncharacterized protein n=2 Tax=Thermoactinomyces intermedius TaxID=2024 RepID=A0A8I1DFT6_THEIN|nr:MULTISPECIES: hypothetical protein [Thermoactinomyces]MBA4548327.1 hypothetical protein [Thermoactinomyces intermedius]MBH8595171.1 hypothetical protein [Thermoactinomyces intermedius]MBH8601890.1 hypothetical protein [Thermoactinomyces sp. CICC 23799]
MMQDQMERKKRVERLAEQIEAEILNAIREGGPQPYYTEMYLNCAICYQEKKRTELRIAEDPDQIFDEFAVCFDCIARRNLMLSHSERALDFEARTLAILRIKNGVMKPQDWEEEEEAL